MAQAPAAAHATSPADDHAADDNRFACPLPPLSVSCGMRGLAFAGSDAYGPAACPERSGLAYHPI